MADAIWDVINDLCEDEVEDNKDSLRNPAYLPQDAFKLVMTEGRVGETIERHTGSLNTREKAQLLEYAHKNPRIFLTLAWCGLVAKIKVLCEDGVKDCHLPIQQHQDKAGKSWRSTSLADPKNKPKLSPHAFVKGHDKREWNGSDLSRFITEQWRFYAVVFDARKFLHRGLSPKCPLPFVQIPAGAPASGNFGKVFKVGLRREHLKLESSHADIHLGQVADLPRLFEVAVKQLQRVNGASEKEIEAFFEKEVTTLKRMRTLKDAHLIQAIAVYERGSERCIVFPWAPKGNLVQFWTHHSNHRSEKTQRWAWDQILGLTRGVAKLHGKVNGESIRHGDLKPANILRFSDTGGSELGTLVVADVGIAKYHAFETEVRKNKNDPTTNRTGTQRYTPPEIEVPEKDDKGKLRIISRRYDSWSLGCVLLEFITWLRHGRDGLRRLDTERCRDCKPGVDRYWEQYGDDYPVLRPAVHQFVGELLDDHELRTHLRELLREVKGQLLVPSVTKRKYIFEFLERLEEITESCSADPCYLWGDEMEVLTEPREPAAVVADADIFPISQRYVSP